MVGQWVDFFSHKYNRVPWNIFVSSLNRPAGYVHTCYHRSKDRTDCDAQTVKRQESCISLYLLLSSFSSRMISPINHFFLFFIYIFFPSKSFYISRPRVDYCIWLHFTISLPKPSSVWGTDSKFFRENLVCLQYNQHIVHTVHKWWQNFIFWGELFL